MAYSAPLNGTVISAANINVTQGGSRLLTSSLISQRAGFNPWYALPGSGSVTATIAPIQDSSVPGGLVWQFAAPNGTAIYTMGPLLPVDTARTYLGRIWAKQTAGPASAFSAGYVAFNSSGTQLTGNGNGGSYGYFIALGQTPPAGGAFYNGWVTGTGGNTTNITFPAGTSWIQPLIVYVGGATAWSIQVSVPELWEGAGYNGGQQGNPVTTVPPSLWIPSTVHSVPANTDFSIAASGSGWIFVSQQSASALNHQVYAVNGTAVPTGMLAGSTNWLNGGATIASGQAKLFSSGGLLKLVQNFNGSAVNVLVTLMGTGF